MIIMDKRSVLNFKTGNFLYAVYPCDKKLKKC